ncbi:serine hydrolase [Streptomyces sp. NPDC060194]|uniref:serine hydrolase n=1 Tax=Streptomyces sp. NPDC060194 TaxID=3347069 RepID=UPI00364A9EB1
MRRPTAPDAAPPRRTSSRRAAAGALLPGPRIRWRLGLLAVTGLALCVPLGYGAPVAAPVGQPAQDGVVALGGASAVPVPERSLFALSPVGGPPLPEVAEAAPSGTAEPEPPAVTPDEALAAALGELGPHTGRFAVGVTDLTTGTTVHSARQGEPFATASTVKVDVVAALLLQAQDRGRGLTAEERRLAEAAIRVSDNEATHTLWARIGRRPGLDAADERLGIARSRTDPGASWGVTLTTTRDRIALLRAVFTDDSPLTAASRRTLRGLMAEVVPDQAWGVSAAGTRPALKNGWLPRDATGLWVVNSTGRVERDGHTLLVTVLSDGHPAMAPGVGLVEEVAEAAAAAVVEAG